MTSYEIALPGYESGQYYEHKCHLSYFFIFIYINIYILS